MCEFSPCPCYPGRSWQFKVRNLIGGKLKESRCEEWIDVRNPATQTVVCKVPRNTQDEVSAMPKTVTYKSRNTGNLCRMSTLTRERLQYRAYNID